MEDHSNFLPKVIAGVVIALLAFNIYRTETSIKQVDRISATVDSLAASIDMPTSTKIDNAKTAELADEVAKISKKIEALEKMQAGSPAKPSANATKPSTDAAKPASSSGSATGRVSVTAKVKVEDRYVRGRTPLPSISVGPAGTVVVGITLDITGMVTKARIKSGTTISDEEVLDACKVAALKTEFSMNFQASEHAPGTITYTFTLK